MTTAVSSQFLVDAHRNLDQLGVSNMKISGNLHGASAASCLAEVRDFDAHTVDYPVQPEDMVAQVRPDGSLSIILKNHDMILHPRLRFLTGLSGYVNSNTPVDRLTGTFLQSLAACEPDGATWAANLIDYLLQRLQEAYSKKNNKGLKVRAIRPDKAKKWASTLTARALVHANFREDISHRWLMETMMQFVQCSGIRGWRFNGDLMMGHWLIPSEARADRYGDEFHGGLTFFHGEVGNRTAGICPFLYRPRYNAVIMMPSRRYATTWGARHVGGKTLDDLHESMEDAVNDQIPLISSFLSSILEMRNISIPSDILDNVVVIVGGRVALTQGEMRRWRQHVDVVRTMEGDDVTALTLQTALAAVAGECDSPDRELDLEVSSGRMCRINWDAALSDARSIDQERVAKILKTGSDAGDDNGDY